ncbi:hypothetical protein L6R52_39665 [Myxococcota bacterium]|nr:hypothetical protein [Myxococcota bacterium]
MSDTTDPSALAAAVLRAVEETERDLERMPFFVRPMVRAGFNRRTGLNVDEWRASLGGVRADDAPDRLRRDLKPALLRLREHFRTAPERARRGMGNDPRAIAEVTNRSRLRAEAVEALLAWIDAPR